MIEIRGLGLAAYVRMNGGIIKGFQNRVFLFESERDANEWEIDYANACCSRHDAEVMNLRKLMKKE